MVLLQLPLRVITFARFFARSYGWLQYALEGPEKEATKDGSANVSGSLLQTSCFSFSYAVV